MGEKKEQTQGEQVEQIPKRIAVIEVMRRCKTIQNVCVVSIAGFFIVAICATFMKMAGAISAGVLSAGMGFLLWQNKLDYSSLSQRHNVDMKKDL